MKRPTQVDVARKAGVSRATVSYVMNGLRDGRVPISAETRQRVQQAIAELGYEPDTRAQALRSGDTNTLGLIIPDMQNPHFVENATSIEREARAHGYHLLLSSMDLSSEYGEDIFKDLSGRRIDGLILEGSFIDQSAEAKKTLERLVRHQLPIVEITDRMNLDHNLDCVVSNYTAATREVMAQLFALRHRRIGFVYGVANYELGLDRLQPYLDCLQAAGISDGQDSVIQCGPTTEDGYQAGLQLLQRSPRPTAVIVINDQLAIGVMRAAGDLGLRIPEDVSLVGFDDIPEARYLVPRLTTVSKDAARIGREAVRMVVERIQDPNMPARRVEIAACLLMRESTGIAPLEEK